jgi:hypothetical protein
VNPELPSAGGVNPESPAAPPQSLPPSLASCRSRRTVLRTTLSGCLLTPYPVEAVFVNVSSSTEPGQTRSAFEFRLLERK